LDRPPEAEKAYRQAIARLNKLADEYPAVPIYRDKLAEGYDHLGTLLAGRGKDADAETAYRQAIALREKLVADFPAVLQYRQDLAYTYLNYANLFRDRSQPQAAQEWYAKAMPLLQSILAQDPSITPAQLYLRDAHSGRAGALDQLGHYAESARDWQRAAELDDGPTRSILRLQQSAALAHAGKYQDAVKAVEEVLASSDPKGKTPPSGAQLYEAGRAFALSAAAVKDDAMLRDQYAARAIVLLRQAKTAGFFKDPKQVENFKKDTDLDTLRQRDEYQKFAAELAEEGKR
jgi:tetratricopeptide (TPR) repeat protein